MAADQERAERIRALKQARPDLTWRRIADHVGVTERSATDWQKKGGIEFENAKKLAALFEVDVDYIWRGTESDTPSPFAGQDQTADQLERVEALLRQQNELLDRQSAVLERIEAAIAREQDAARAAEEATRRLLDAAETAGVALRGATQGPESTPAPQAT
jgi:hypothetical protein